MQKGANNIRNNNAYEKRNGQGSAYPNQRNASMTYGNTNSMANGQQNLRAVTNQTTDGSTHPTTSSGATMQTQQKGASQTYNQVSANGIVRRRVENLPRTGIEYPMMRDLGHPPFKGNQKEFEPLSDQRLSPALLEEYIKNDADRSENAPGSM